MPNAYAYEVLCDGHKLYIWQPYLFFFIYETLAYFLFGRTFFLFLPITYENIHLCVSVIVYLHAMLNFVIPTK